jgi:hypothetical protein
MPNDASKAEFWKEFLCARSEFPAPEKLRAQFAQAEFTDFCQCGCNSFGLIKTNTAKAAPLTGPGKYGAAFAMNFWLEGAGTAGGRGTLEITLFTDADGNLKYVEVHHSANAFPMPESVTIVEPPFHIHASETLMA